MDSDRMLNLARCPNCFEVIDAASATCRFCNSALDPMQMKSAAASFRASVEAKSKMNDSRSMRAAIIGLIAIVAFAGYVFFRRMDRMQRTETADNIKRLQKAVHDKDYKSAIAGARSFVDNDPNNAMLHLLLATVLGSSGDSVDAVSELQAARQLDPKNPKPPLLLGITYYDRKIYESADLWLTNAIELDRKSGKPVQYRGLSRFMLDKTDSAMEDFRTAERLEPKTYPVTCSLA
jgi:cytochrome c-type biogenesis protein CcmH/NrfG